MTIRTETPAGRLVDDPKRSPRHLPYAAYPKASGRRAARLATIARVPAARRISRGPTPTAATGTPRSSPPSLTPGATLADGVGDSRLAFARREPQARHLRPPKNPPAGLMEARHTDPFGTVPFGSWDTATQMYWIVRLAALTDPTRHRGTLSRSTRTSWSNPSPSWTERGASSARRSTRRCRPSTWNPRCGRDDPFLDTVFTVWEPVYAALGAQDAEALAALSERYPAFRKAYDEGKVTHHLLVARSDDLPKEDAFELVAASAERCRALGYEYMVTEATNQWTGAAFEALGGVRVHFAPFQAEPAVPKSDEPLEDATTSPNGFLSDKDSGGMFYVIRLD